MKILRSSLLLLVWFQYLRTIVLPVLASHVHGLPKFAYNEATGKGPSKWGELRHHWTACELGHEQSPIAINYDILKNNPTLGPLQTFYKPATAGSKEADHGVKVAWHGDAGYLFLNGTQYNLVQMHWHWGSEHTYNGSRYAMELHLVHESPKGLAAIGIMYKIGPPDPLLAMLLPKLHGFGKAEREIGVIDPRSILFDKSGYYRYVGSLTTPPCHEGVVWTMIKKIRYVSANQVAFMKHMANDTYGSIARPLQRLYGRKIDMYVS